MHEPLKSCPFCGNANAIMYDDLLTFHVGCLSCGATGSASSYRNGAIAAWNRRTQPTPPAVVEPLTVQQIWASDEIMSANAMPMDDLLRIVRAVEAARGIGVKKENGNG